MVLSWVYSSLTIMSGRPRLGSGGASRHTTPPGAWEPLVSGEFRKAAAQSSAVVAGPCGMAVGTFQVRFEPISWFCSHLIENATGRVSPGLYGPLTSVSGSWRSTECVVLHASGASG